MKIKKNKIQNKIKSKSKSKSNNKMKIIDQVQSIRSKNNKNWMDLLRLAYSLDPKNTSKLIKSISKNDSKINQVLKKI